MTKEFNLSKKLWNMGIIEDEMYIKDKDVKEFIKKLKEEIDSIEYGNIDELCKITVNEAIKRHLNKLAGDKLI